MGKKERGERETCERSGAEGEDGSREDGLRRRVKGKKRELEKVEGGESDK